MAVEIESVDDWKLSKLKITEMQRSSKIPGKTICVCNPVHTGFDLGTYRSTLKFVGKMRLFGRKVLTGFLKQKWQKN